jgi:hypothetical protein
MPQEYSMDLQELARLPAVNVHTLPIAAPLGHIQWRAPGTT